MRISDWSSDVCSSDLPLVAILLLSILSIWLELPVNTVGGMGKLPEGLPSIVLPNVPLTLETLRIILPYSLTMAAVRSEEHTSELQSLMRISYAVFCLKKKKTIKLLILAP